MKHYKRIQLILFSILLANLLVTVLKIVIGMAIGSTSLTADGYHSLSDGTSNIIGMIGLYFAAKPSDENHPYGHHKIETIAGLGIGILLVGVTINVLKDAIGAFSSPQMPIVTSLSLAVLVLTLIINIAVTTYEHRRGLALNSSFLISDAAHTKSDIFVTLGVLTTLIGLRLGLPPILDPLCSLVVAGFIGHAAYEVLHANINMLLDSVAMQPDSIAKVAMGIEGVKDVHKIRSRGGSGIIEIDLHVKVDPLMSTEDAHKISHNIEDAVRDEFECNCHVLAHIEPYREK